MPWNIDLPTTQYLDLASLQAPGGPELLEKLIRELNDQKYIAIDTETTGLSVWKDLPLYWSLAWTGRRMTLNANILPYFRAVFANPNITWFLANAKYDAHILANVGIELVGPMACIQLMHSLLYEEMPHDLKFIAQHILGWTWASFTDQFGKINKKQSASDVIHKAETQNMSLLVEYAANDAWGTYNAGLELLKQLARAKTHSLFRTTYPYIDTLEDLYWKTEVPYTRVLWEMEREGVRINKPHLDASRPVAEADILRIQKELNKLKGGVINPNSPDQVAKWLIEELGLASRKMTKGGKTGVRKPSVDEGFLEFHKHSHPAAALLLEFRGQSKLLKTYINGLANWMDPDDRIHTKFNQSVARTGRLSCVAEWTPIKTPNGATPIKNLNAGDLVFTHKKRWRMATRVFTKGLDHMYSMRFSNGDILTCTADHKLLRTGGSWVTAGEVIDELLKRLGQCRDEQNGGIVSIPQQRNADCDSNRRTPDHELPQRVSSTEGGYAGSRTQGTSQDQILSIEVGKQEPDEGQEGRGASSLERRVRGRQRIPDLPAQRTENVRTRCSDTAGAEAEIYPRGLGGSSHRQRPEEQRSEKSGSDHTCRTSNYSLSSSNGLSTVTLEEIEYCGCLEVYDVTVDEDASYEACGVLNHNSSDPNLQNIPKLENDKWGLRKSFIPEEGNVIICGDFSQLEMRLLACAAMEEGMIDVFRRGWDIHMGNAALMFNIPYEDIKLAKKIDKEVHEGKRPEADITDYVKSCLARRYDAKSIGFGQPESQAEVKLPQNGELFAARAA